MVQKEGKIVDKYESWLTAGWKKLNDDFKESFRPQNESDIKCHLYHTLLETKSQISGMTPNHLVLSEFKFPTTQKKIDLALVRWKKKGAVFQARLIVEIKETSRTHKTTEQVENKINSDIEKLRRYIKALKEQEKTDVLKYFKKPAICFFFRGASMQGIGTKTDQGMETIQEKYDDIILLWGPR